MTVIKALVSAVFHASFSVYLQFSQYLMHMLCPREAGVLVVQLLRTPALFGRVKGSILTWLFT